MSRNLAAVTNQLRTLLEPALQADGCDLEDVTVTVAGRRRLVRVVVDRNGGLTLDAVAAVSGTVSDVLDSADPLGDAPYVLEVSSPGVDRPLRERRHWRRATGRLVTVAVSGAGTVTARISVADDEGVVLTDSDGGQERRWAYAALGPGAVQVEFGRPTSSDELDGDTDTDTDTDSDGTDTDSDGIDGIDGTDEPIFASAQSGHSAVGS